MRCAPLALLLMLQASCDHELSLGRWLDADAPVDAGAGLAAFSCDQRGALLDLTDTAVAACGSASRGFHYALCSCSELISGDRAEVDGFDSRAAPYARGQASGALGANGALFPHALQTSGSLIVGGGAGIPLQDDLAIGGNLFDQGQLQGAHAVTVGGRARIAGDVRLDRFQVAGSCTLASSSALEVTAGAPSVTREAISIAPPCLCDDTLDFAGLLERASQDNDNAALGIDATSTLTVFDAPLELALPCGRYYVGDINGQRPITLHVQGRVALFVQHRIVIDQAASLTIDLVDAAELDLFVGEGISAGGPVAIGPAHAATRARLHFGAPDTLFFGATTTLAASLYAPHAELVTNGSLELFGAALVRRSSAAGPLLLHYDRALARDSCARASCTSDADCTALLRCDNGACLP
jgi:hypothetical protein